MRFNHLFTITLFCIVVACTKKKDDTAPQVDPPVTNNPTPNKPTDSTNTPPKAKPVFTDFAPVNAFIGDTITLTGTNFETNTGKFTVHFGNVSATLISATATQVQVVVPDDIETAKINIQLNVADTTLIVNKEFSLKAPVIESVSPTIGFARQLVQIKGKGFRKSYKFDMVTIMNP